MSIESIRLPSDSIHGHPSLLQQEIPALQLMATENGHARWGPMTRLPRGAELHEFGKGFDDQTVLVRVADSFYIVFAEDLASAQKPIRRLRHAQSA
jgi:hypothetical protein